MAHIDFVPRIDDAQYGIVDDDTLWPTHGGPITNPKVYLGQYLRHRPVRNIVAVVIATCLGMSIAGQVEADSNGDDSGTTTTSTTSILVDTTPEIPPKSGTGRRIVYANKRQRVWVVNADDDIIRTFLVSGRRGVPTPGSYRVLSQSVSSFSPELQGVTFRFMTRFAIGPHGGNIGFHELPLRNGKPMQTASQLGTFIGGGCLRSTTADARFIFQWARIGTPVVVVP